MSRKNDTDTDKPATMKAMTYSRYGESEVLEVSNVPIPKVPPGSVLVRVKAAAVNPVDWKIMAGGLDALMDIHFPVIPGWDVAGVVDAVGFDTPEFAVGDEVYSYGRRDSVQGGTFAELVMLPAPIVSRKPAGLTWEQAAGLPLAGLAAQRTLDTFDLPAVAAAGGTLLIHNGSGGVGRAAIQIAAHAGKGLRILATASPTHHDRLRELGAEPVEYGDGLVERVRELVPDGVDAVADFVGGVLQQTLAVLRTGGQHASLADNTVTEHGGRYVWVRPDSKELDRLSALVDAGQLTVDVARTYPLQKLADAFSESRDGHTSGKLILTPFTD